MARIEIESGYPWKGEVTLTVTPGDRKHFRLALHVPGYLQNTDFQVRHNGKPAGGTIQAGYFYLDRTWSHSDVVKITFPLEPRRIYGTVRCLDTVGAVAMSRGPVVYCFEEADNGAQLQALLLRRGAVIEEVFETEGVLAGTVTLAMDGLREAEDALPLTDIRTKLQSRFEWSDPTVKTLLRRLCEKNAVAQ